MKFKLTIPALFLRLALAATYISGYSSRINLFGGHPAGWQKFLKYASEVNSFAPQLLQPFLAITATVLEITFSILLIVGFKTRQVAIASGTLTFLFAMAMTYSFGVKEPLDDGVFVNFTSAFLLAAI
ncbi:MAG: DoxX family membrane protein, partial [Bacteroidia bacterium]